MSGIVGIYRSDNSPIDQALVERMLQTLAHRGPDRQGVWVKGPIGLGHRLLFTTAESLREHQPVTDAGTMRALVWDGRLDNREELIRSLEQAGIGIGAKTDPELMLGAHQAWGEQCPEKLVGEFACAIWDARQRSLFCVRDRLGLRPFHYRWDGKTFLFASEIKPLLAACGSTPEPDDEIILALLLREFREPDHERTFFHGIRRLPPGHLLRVKDGRAQLSRYWAIEPTREIRYAQDADYADHFRSLFQEVVRCRLRSYFPIGVSVSGGLDSSAIVCAAHALGSERGETWPQIEAFNMFSHDPGSDERGYFDEVIGATGLKAHRVPYTESDDPLNGLADALKKVESPIVEIGSQDEDVILQAMRSRGCRILLSGEGGDQLLDDFGTLSDFLAGGHLWRFFQETKAMARWYGGSPWEFAEVASAIPLPQSVKYWSKRLLRGVPPGWMNSETARTVGLRARIREPRHHLQFASFCQAYTYLSITNPYYVLKLEVDERAAAWSGVEIRYPFLDYRLVEFVLSIPSARRTKHGVWKGMFREAMRGLMPESVRLRKGKGHWTESSDRVLTALCRRDHPAPLQNLSGRLWHYLDQHGARAFVDRYLNGERDLRYDVWFLITLDHWLACMWGRD